MEEAYSYYTAPLRLPDSPRKGIPWLKVDTSPTTLYGDGLPEAVDRKYYGNTSPPPSLCSCGNCADYPDAVDPDDPILDADTFDSEALDSRRQAKRDAVPRGKRPRAKPSCLYADKRYMSDSELDAVVQGPAIEFKTMEQVDQGPTEAFPVFIDDNLKVHDYFACHFGVPTPQEPGNDNQSDEKISATMHRRRTFPKTPAPVCKRKSTDNDWEPDLDFVLDSAVQTAKQLQSGAEDLGEVARRLEGQIAIVKVVVNSKKATSAGTRSHHPLSAIITVVCELTCVIAMVFCTLAITVNDQYVSYGSDGRASLTYDPSLRSKKSNSALRSINIVVTVARIFNMVWSIVDRRAPSIGDREDDPAAIDPEPAEKQVDSSAIIDEDGF